MRSLESSPLRARRRRLGAALQDESLTVDQKLKYTAIALRYTVPVPRDISGYDEDLVSDLSNAIRQVLAGHPDAEELLTKIRDVWIPILAKKIQR